MSEEPVPEFDLYDELEVSRAASAETITAAYRSLVKRYHPDTGVSAPDRIKRLNIAYEWLTDPVNRRRFDEEQAARRRGEPEGPRSSSPSQSESTPGVKTTRAGGAGSARSSSTAWSASKAGPARRVEPGASPGRVRTIVLGLAIIGAALLALNLRVETTAAPSRGAIAVLPTATTAPPSTPRVSIFSIPDPNILHGATDAEPQAPFRGVFRVSGRKSWSGMAGGFG